MSDIKLGKYKHYKGNIYEVVGICTHSETLEEMVVYKALYGDGRLWVRPAKMWFDDVAVENQTVKRFTYFG